MQPSGLPMVGLKLWFHSDLIKLILSTTCLNTVLKFVQVTFREAPEDEVEARQPRIVNDHRSLGCRSTQTCRKERVGLEALSLKAPKYLNQNRVPI